MPQNHGLSIIAQMPSLEQVKDWRKAERKRLLEDRMAVDPATIADWRLAIDARLAKEFPPRVDGAVLALCWPIKNEYDARHLAKTLRERGALTVLPVVVAPRTALVFRAWHPGVELAEGVMGIPYPVGSPEHAPTDVLLPMNGWDAEGYRLGYGGGFFDRTLAAAAPRPRVIGVSYEMARLETIHPQSWDIPVDMVVTERGTYRRKAGRLLED
jgi:5-formyltetrahydrofolate cyclo-ligase